MAEPLLGDLRFEPKKFQDLEATFSRFEDPAFEMCNAHEKSNWVSRALFDLIQKEERETFFLEAIVDFISQVKEKNIVESYTFSSFELWLNHYSHLSYEENYQLRGKIIGKFIPRDSYQIFFPIGMGKTYPGTHFVTAHSSPDLDSTVASFWGWIDAFGARVGEGLHIWNVPGGPPFTQVEVDLLFKRIFGARVFDCLTKTYLSLTLNSLDLMSQDGVIKRQTHEIALSLDYGKQKSAVILVDEGGYYLGDWRATDVEGVRQVVMALNNCLMWLEATLHIKLVSCLAEKQVTTTTLSETIREILGIKIVDCAPAKEFTFTLHKFVHDYLVKVFRVERGMEATFEEFARAIEKFEVVNFTEILSWLKTLTTSNLFDSSGTITKDRSLLFHHLEILLKMLARAFAGIRKYVDRLEIAFRIKTDVFGYTIPLYLTPRTEIEEVRSKIGSYSFLTVNHIDEKGRYIPIGVVHASDLQRMTLGTVTLRDFCNRDEMKIPSYLEVISVIDHHKSSLITNTPPTVIISDAQSSNALLAQMAFSLNDQYGVGGMDEKTIDQQIKAMEKDLSTAQKIRIYQRLLQKKKFFRINGPYFSNPRREFIEYLHFVYAILDDTDLLTKVTRLDVECIGSLLNRLKSLIMKKEVEIVHFDDIREDRDFTKKAAQRLLQNKDFYSLYSKVYLHKESGVDKNLDECVKGLPSNIFSDVKVLNICNRVGQTKIFACNYSHFTKVAHKLRRIWVHDAFAIYGNNREIMLHLHMISTIASADELFKGKAIHYEHQDELWIWIPDTDFAIGQLKLFLNALKSHPGIHNLNMNVEFLGENAKELSQVFKESFISIPHHLPIELKKEEALPIAVLRFDAGTMNSRKAMISPYLPHLEG